MKTSKKLFALLLSLALTVALLTAFFPVCVTAEEDGFTRHIELNVADGPIRIYTDRYYQNDVEHPGFSCETTQYVITGVALNANAVLRFIQDEDDVPVATFHAIFRNLYISPAAWCSVVHFKTYKPDPEEGEPAPMTVNLRLEGTNRISGFNHPGLSGNATVNLSAAPDSRSRFSPEYADTPNGFDGALTLNQVGEYEVKVNQAVADLEAGKTGKPVEIVGADSTALVAAKINALPSASEVGLSDKDAVAAARAAYDALPIQKQEEFDAETLRRLTDDENAIAEQEDAYARSEAEKNAAINRRAKLKRRLLTALWVVLGFLGGAGCAVGTLFLLEKRGKTYPVTAAEIKAEVDAEIREIEAEVDAEIKAEEEAKAERTETGADSVTDPGSGIDPESERNQENAD